MGVGSITNMQSGLIVESINSARSANIQVNSSTDYNGLNLVLASAESMRQAVQEFIYTFDPRRFYMYSRGLYDKPLVFHKLDTYA